MLHFPSHDYSVTTNLYFLIPSSFSPSLPNPLLFGNYHSVVCIYIHLFDFLDSTCKKLYWYLSFSAWCVSLSIIPSRFIHVVTDGKISFFFFFIVLLIYAFICWFLYVPWPGVKPATLAYQNDSLTRWDTWPGWFHSFLWLSKIPLCVYRYIYIFFIYFSIDEHLGCFYILAIVSKAAMNIWMHMSL